MPFDSTTFTQVLGDENIRHHKQWVSSPAEHHCS